jgi:hypothetical protein
MMKVADEVYADISSSHRTAGTSLGRRNLLRQSRRVHALKEMSETVYTVLRKVCEEEPFTRCCVHKHWDH